MSTSETTMAPDATPSDPFHAVRGTLAFLRSWIRSGEEWDSVCEGAYQRAVAALDTATNPTPAAPAQPEPRTPDETLAAKLDEMGRMLGNPSLRDAAKRLRELAGDKARMDWLVVNAGESREAIDWARGRAAQPTEGTDA